jgi:hypothetical protein
MQSRVNFVLQSSTKELEMGERFDTFSPQPPGQGERDFAAGAPGTPDDEEGGLDPREAARLLEESRIHAEHQLDLRPPLLALVAAAVMLICYGAIWLSVRNQHPYTGPSGTALAVLYGTLLAWGVLNVVVLGRRMSGVGGRSAHRRRIEGLAFAAIWISIYVFQGALLHAGASHGIVYGIWPAAAPLVVVGAAAAAYAVGRGKSPALEVMAIALGAGAAFAGPAAVWGVIAVGASALLALWGALRLWQRRA